MLTPDPGSEIIGGATTVIFDCVANGKRFVGSCRGEGATWEGYDGGGDNSLVSPDVWE